MKLMQRPAVPLVVTLALLIAGWSSAAMAAISMTVPVRPKDMLYLIHADNLIPTETGAAAGREEEGDTHQQRLPHQFARRTPLAEPPFNRR